MNVFSNFLIRPSVLLIGIVVFIWAMIMLILLLTPYPNAQGVLIVVTTLLLFFSFVVAVLMIPILAIFRLIFRKNRGRLIVAALAEGVRANLPLPAWLDAAARAESGPVAIRLRGISSGLVHGHPLSALLDSVAREIPAADRRLIAAGEAAGRLPQVLDRIAQRNRLASARKRTMPSTNMIIPVFTVATLIYMSALLMIYIVPQFEKIFQDFGTPLPDITVNWISFSSWMGGRGYADQAIPGLLLIPLFLSLPVIAWFFVGWFRAGRYTRDTLAERCPLLGAAIRWRGVSDGCSISRQSLLAGDALPAALAAAAAVQTNEALRDRFEHWRHAVQEGRPVGEAARAASLPDIVADMVSTAQTAGNLPATLDFLDSYYAGRLGRLAAAVNAAWYPALTLVLGVLVGSAVLAIFSPLPTLIFHMAHMTGTY